MICARVAWLRPGTYLGETNSCVDLGQRVDREGDVGREDEVVRERDRGGEDAVVDLCSSRVDSISCLSDLKLLLLQMMD